MGRSGEFYTEDEVLSRLGITEKTLKRLVSQEEIRKFIGEGGVIKYRRTDVENLDTSGAAKETRGPCKGGFI